jgi:hypothetical protein
LLPEELGGPAARSWITGSWRGVLDAHGEAVQEQLEAELEEGVEAAHCILAISSSRARQRGGGGTGSWASPNTASAISRTSWSLPGTWRYSDMTPTPSSAATRRIESAVSPSVSAIAMAAWMMRSRVSS